MHNVFSKEINKIALSWNDVKNEINWFDWNISLWNKQRSIK